MADPKGMLVVPVGFRLDGSIHALELDNSDRLKVFIDPITGVVTVSQSDPAALLTGVHGWDGNTWQKMVVNASSHLKNDPHLSKNGRGAGIGTLTQNLALAAGTNTLNDAVVPANHKYVVRNISAIYTGTVAGVQLNINLVIGGTVINIRSFTGITSGVANQVPIDFPMTAGDNVRLAILGATLNDDGFLYVIYEDLV